MKHILIIKSANRSCLQLYSLAEQLFLYCYLNVTNTYMRYIYI